MSGFSCEHCGRPEAEQPEVACEHCGDGMCASCTTLHDTQGECPLGYDDAFLESKS